MQHQYNADADDKYYPNRGHNKPGLLSAGNGSNFT